MISDCPGSGLLAGNKPVWLKLPTVSLHGRGMRHAMQWTLVWRLRPILCIRDGPLASKRETISIERYGTRSQSILSSRVRRKRCNIVTFGPLNDSAINDSLSPTKFLIPNIVASLSKRISLGWYWILLVILTVNYSYPWRLFPYLYVSITNLNWSSKSVYVAWDNAQLLLAWWL